MCATSLMSVMFCVLLIFVSHFNSFVDHHYNDYNDMDFNYTPEISVEGNYILISEFPYETLIKLGETVEILCTGENDELKLYSLIGESVLNPLSAESINKTTIRYITTPEVIGIMRFRCKNLDSPSSMYSMMTLVIDGPPDVKKFNCISDNLLSLVCDWSTTNKIGNFTLYLYSPVRTTIFCYTEINIYKESDDFSCRVHGKYTSNITLQILMLSCSYTYCLNKTYDFNYLSIVKIDPPTVISISRYRNGGENSVYLSFAIPIDTFIIFGAAEYRVEYVMFGSRSRQVNTSLLFNVVNRGSRFLYGVAFDLPCSGRKYDITVSVKTKQALDDRYWSDVATISYTTPINKTINSHDDATCSEEEIVETAKIMVYELRKFNVKFREDQSQLKRKIRELKMKTRVDQKAEH